MKEDDLNSDILRELYKQYLIGEFLPFNHCIFKFFRVLLLFLRSAADNLLFKFNTIIKADLQISYDNKKEIIRSVLQSVIFTIHLCPNA